MQAYITSIGFISPQDTLENDFSCRVDHEGEYVLRCIEPVYKDFINPVQLRRMSRILKLSLGASQMCLNRAGGIQPDAIVVGTGLACINDLEIFLSSMIDEKEQGLSPIPFINSSHNTVAAQIARNLKNHGYNNTFCHRGTSFESALLDTLLLINSNEAGHVLLGGVDEFSAHYYSLLDQLQLFQNEANPEGTVAGEGAGFFMISKNQTPQTYAQIKDAGTLYSVADYKTITGFITGFLSRNNLSVENIGSVLLGLNGNKGDDIIYNELIQNYFSPDSKLIRYKHLCGEYTTNGAFAMALAAGSISCGQFPGTCIIRPGNPNRNSLDSVLIYNHYRGTNHSLILLEKVSSSKLIKTKDSEKREDR